MEGARVSEFFYYEPLCEKKNFFWWGVVDGWGEVGAAGWSK